MICYTYEEFCEKFGKETVDKWLNNVKMEDLMNCMDAFSNDSFVDYDIQHRDKDLNILEMILQETPKFLYRTVTYGVAPNETCTSAIGYITNRKYGNVDIAEFLIREKIHELKNWLLINYEFSDREIRLLHYFKN